MPKKSLLKNKTIIVGCGRLGANIANKISKEGKNRLVIEANRQAFERLSDSFSGYQIVGDATDLDILEEAYISSAREIIIATGDDNVNLFLALVAREVYDVPHIYVRFDDPEIAVLTEGKNIELILPFQLTYDKFNLVRGGKK